MCLAIEWPIALKRFALAISQSRATFRPGRSRITIFAAYLVYPASRLNLLTWIFARRDEVPFFLRACPLIPVLTTSPSSILYISYPCWGFVLNLLLPWCSIATSGWDYLPTLAEGTTSSIVVASEFQACLTTPDAALPTPNRSQCLQYLLLYLELYYSIQINFSVVIISVRDKIFRVNSYISTDCLI